MNNQTKQNNKSNKKQNKKKNSSNQVYTLVSSLFYRIQYL